MKRRPAIALGVLLLFSLLHAQETRDDPEGMMKYRFDMRKNENGEIPPHALMDAKRELDLRRLLPKGTQRQTMDAGLTGWEWLGPGNVGGRIRSIVINPTVPNVMYVGSVSGGIWRTDNAGENWYPLTDFMANLNVSSIVMDPTNPLTLYAGTGEAGFGGATGAAPLANPAPGAGIFKSTDAGLNWTQLPSTDTSTFQVVSRLAHHPTLSNNLLAATNTGVYKTTDGGITWRNTLPVAALQVKYNPTDGTRVLCGTSNAFILSFDGGDSWSIETTGGPGQLPSGVGRCEGDFSSTDSSIYVNVDRNDGEVWRSTDGGRTWALRSTGVQYFGGQGGYDNAIWVDPTNSNTIVLSGRNLQRSTDGGLTLQKIGGDTSGAMIYSVHPDIHAIVSHPQYDGSSNKTVFIGCDGGIYATSDITTASLTSGWQYLNNFLGITQFYSGSSASDGSLIAGAAQDNDRLHYTPAGGIEGWYVTPYKNGGSLSGGDGTAIIVDPTNASRIYAEVTRLNIGRSDDGGHTYNTKTNGIVDVGRWVSPLVMDPNNANTLLAGGTKIWRTTDQGEDWSMLRNALVGPPSCTAIAIAAGNSNLIWVGYDNAQLSYTTDGGSTWTNLAGGGRPATAVTSVAINPTNNAVVMVSYGGYISNNVWLTEDGGTTWSQRTGGSPYNLPAIQVNTVTFHPVAPTWVYVGTDLGVFASEDRGNTWNVLGSYIQNEGPANVEVSQLFWRGNTDLLAATFGRGMFRAFPNTGIFVDISNPNTGDGSFGNPFHNVQDAINAQINGVPIFIFTGTYQQAPLSFTKRGTVRVWNGPVIIK